jgi:hypothetical protein
MPPHSAVRLRLTVDSFLIWEATPPIHYRFMRQSLMKEIISDAGKAEPFRTVRRHSRRRLSVICVADGVCYFLAKRAGTALVG